MRSVIRVLCMMGVVLIGLSFGGGKVAAAQGAYNAKWIIKTYAENGQLHVLWEVTVWEVGQPSNTNQSVTKLACAVAPSVNIQFDHIEFAGNGAIHCSVPSFQAEVLNLSHGQLYLPAEIQSQDIYAEADFSFIDTTLGGLRTLFTHPDFNYAVGHSANTTAEARIGMQQLQIGPSFSTDSSYYLTDDMFQQLGIYQTLTSFLHMKDGNVISVVPWNQSFPVTTGPVTICIGCGPNGFFVGELWYGEFDPGCVNTCGM
ncbi:MAG: hypothetical protein AAF614_15470 [Chloroflexota bacterium]